MAVSATALTSGGTAETPSLRPSSDCTSFVSQARHSGGTLVDQHATDRYHTRWHLWGWNKDRATTLYYIVSVADGAS